MMQKYLQTSGLKRNTGTTGYVIADPNHRIVISQSTITHMSHYAYGEIREFNKLKVGYNPGLLSTFLYFSLTHA